MKLSPSQCGQRFCVVVTTRGGWCPVQAYETAARERSSRRRFPTSMPAAQREPPSSSSMCTRMISSNEVSAANPGARPASRPAPAPSRRRCAMIDWSGSRRISRTACSRRPPGAARRSALRRWRCRPGIDSVRRGPISSVSIGRGRRTRNPTAERGEACQCRTVSGTGRTAS